MPVERAELVRLWALRAYDLALVSDNTVALVFNSASIWKPNDTTVACNECSSWQICRSCFPASDLGL
jgi:hypothetical protein